VDNNLEMITKLKKMARCASSSDPLNIVSAVAGSPRAGLVVNPTAINTNNEIDISLQETQSATMDNMVSVLSYCSNEYLNVHSVTSKSIDVYFYPVCEPVCPDGDYAFLILILIRLTQMEMELEMLVIVMMTMTEYQMKWIVIR
jgi:hypothetical protein